MTSGERLLGFIHLRSFEADWKRLDLTDEDLRALELAIMARPQGPKVIPGTAGVRKVRFAPVHGGKGKRGAVRVGYCHFPRFGLVALMAAYGKNEKGDLTADEKKQLRNLVLELDRLLAERRIR